MSEPTAIELRFKAALEGAGIDTADFRMDFDAELQAAHAAGAAAERARVAALIRERLASKAAGLRDSAAESLELGHGMSAGVETIEANTCDEVAEELEDWVRQ